MQEKERRSRERKRTIINHSNKNLLSSGLLSLSLSLSLP